MTRNETFKDGLPLGIRLTLSARRTVYANLVARDWLFCVGASDRDDQPSITGAGSFGCPHCFCSLPILSFPHFLYNCPSTLLILACAGLHESIGIRFPSWIISDDFDKTRRWPPWWLLGSSGMVAILAIIGLQS